MFRSRKQKSRSVLRRSTSRSRNIYSTGSFTVEEKEVFLLYKQDPIVNFHTSLCVRSSKGFTWKFHLKHSVIQVSVIKISFKVYSCLSFTCIVSVEDVIQRLEVGSRIIKRFVQLQKSPWIVMHEDNFLRYIHLSI